MSSLPVFADTLSRLHADIAIVRLLRAGIRADRISAVFPRRRAPNSVCCWLKDFHPVPADTAEPIAAAGVLGRILKSGARAKHVDGELEALGFGPHLTECIMEKTAEGSLVLCVHARNETEASIAWHIFNHVGAENITCPNYDTEWSVRELPEMAPHLAAA